jgi:hypothetical protein
MIVSGLYFQPSLMFEGKARGTPQSVEPERRFAQEGQEGQEGSSLFLKH